MKKNRICISKRLIIISLLILFFLGFTLFTTKLIKLTNSISSKAAIRKITTSKTQVYKQLQKSTEIVSIDFIMQQCQLNKYKYPVFNNDNFNNKYAVYVAYMINWFLHDSIARTPNNFNQLISDMNGDNSQICGLWGNTMIRLLNNYQKNVNPEIALNDIRLLSAYAYYQPKSLLKPAKFIYYNKSQKIGEIDGCLLYYSDSSTKNCKNINTVLSELSSKDNSSYIRDYAEKPITQFSTLKYVIDQSVRDTISPYTTKIYQQFKNEIEIVQNDINTDKYKSGVFYYDPSSAIQAIIMPVAATKLDQAIPKICGSSSLCNQINSSNITNPVEIARILTEYHFGPNSINPFVVDLTQSSYLAYSSIVAIQGLVENSNIKTINLGFDYSSESLEEQIRISNELIAGAHKKGNKAILEIGPSYEYTPQTENPNNIVLTWDIHEHVNYLTSNKPVIYSTKIDINQISPTYWFKGMIQSLNLTGSNRFDEVYMTCPQPENITDTQSNQPGIGYDSISGIVTDIFTRKLSLKSGSSMFIILYPGQNNTDSPYSNSNTIDKLSAMSNDYGYEFQPTNLDAVKNNRSYFTNVNSHYFGNYPLNEIIVLILKRK